MAARIGVDQGKTAFVKDVLTKNSKANAKVVNEAWTAAGREGSISNTLVQKMRAELGLAGNLRARSKTAPVAPVAETPPPALLQMTAPKAQAPKKAPKASAPKTPRPHTNGTATPAAEATERETPVTGVLEEVEAGIDRVIFALMSHGGLPQVEEILRKARRMIVLKTQ